MFLTESGFGGAFAVGRDPWKNWPALIPVSGSIRFNFALARQRLGQVLLSRQNAEDRVRARSLVIVGVFVTRRKAVDPLREHLRNRVFDKCLIPAVGKTLRKTRQQIEPLVALTQQECSSIGTDRSTVKTGYDFRFPDPSKPNL
jgi:hypothetical protein